MMGGDSGGPLVDDGLVLIGIASRVKLDVGENIFVPLGQYRKSWTTIAAGETAAARTGKRKAWLGILGDTDEQRVRVRRVQAESPAAEAGLQAEDVIVTLDGQEIKKFTDVIERLREKRPNESLVIGLNRFGRLLEKSVTLGTR
jgi:S1-C subfamily serine protease